MLSLNLIVDQLCAQDYCQIDSFINEEIFHALSEKAKTLHQQGLYQQAKVGHQQQTQQNLKLRTDLTYWLDERSEDSAIQHYLQTMNELKGILNQTLFLGLNDFETHFAVYPPGSFYKKHIDQFETTKTRKISCVYYLNQEWQPSFGGALKLYNRNNELLQHITPLGNRFICFNSELPHEVEIAYQQRYSIAGWMKTRAYSIDYTL